ncbi:MAG TPA: ABC transporter ATP-binding protein [Herpetosiphonaceae bacterium]
MALVYRIADLTKTYKGAQHPANDRISLDIHAGEIFGLLGPNGAGKSTLVNQMAGLIRPNRGSILLFGMDVVRSSEIVADYVSLQPQHTMAFWDQYPEEAIFHTGLLRGMARAAARKQVDELMAELSLDPLRRRRIRTLSGGQQRLVALAVAFVGDRPVQIFDEPTNDLDPKIRRLVWEKLLHQNQRGATIILVTHNVLEAERIVQRVGIINHGRLMALGTPGGLKARVEQRVRLELLFKSEPNGYRELLQHLGECRALSQQHLTILCHRDTARAAIDHVLAQIGLDQLDDFRILTPSLEDVYLELGGDKRLE